MILSYVRTIILYLVLIFVIRMMGKRQVGQMEPSEFVVTMLVANLASIPMQDGAIPLFSGLVPILTVLAVELVISWLSIGNVGIRKLFCGKPVILIENGKIAEENLRAVRMTLDELTGHLRQKDVLSFTQVQYAILETNGELSVFPYPAQKPAAAADACIEVPPQSLPVTLIADGVVSQENLRLAGRDEAWLQGVLSRCQAAAGETLLLTVDGQGEIQFQKKEKRK